MFRQLADCLSVFRVNIGTFNGAKLTCESRKDFVSEFIKWAAVTEQRGDGERRGEKWYDGGYANEKVNLTARIGCVE